LSGCSPGIPPPLPGSVLSGCSPPTPSSGPGWVTSGTASSIAVLIAWTWAVDSLIAVTAALASETLDSSSPVSRWISALYASSSSSSAAFSSSIVDSACVRASCSGPSWVVTVSVSSVTEDCLGKLAHSGFQPLHLLVQGN
jgi:hypothetical protein